MKMKRVTIPITVQHIELGRMTDGESECDCAIGQACYDVIGLVAVANWTITIYNLRDCGGNPRSVKIPPHILDWRLRLESGEEVGETSFEIEYPAVWTMMPHKSLREIVVEEAEELAAV